MPKENQRRENNPFDALVKIPEKSAGLSVCRARHQSVVRARNIDKKRAESNADKQHRLKLFHNGKVHEKACYDKHDQTAPNTKTVSFKPGIIDDETRVVPKVLEPFFQRTARRVEQYTLKHDASLCDNGK